MPAHPSEGRSADVAGRGWVRRLRAGLVTPHPGGDGAPPGVTTDPCQELADAMSLRLVRMTHGGKARPGTEMRTPQVERRKAGHPCPEDAVVEADCRRASGGKTRTRQWTTSAFRRSTPSHRFAGDFADNPARAAPRETAAHPQTSFREGATSSRHKPQPEGAPRLCALHDASYNGPVSIRENDRCTPSTDVT